MLIFYTCTNFIFILELDLRSYSLEWNQATKYTNFQEKIGDFIVVTSKNMIFEIWHDWRLKKSFKIELLHESNVSLCETFEHKLMRLLAKWANPKTHCSDDILSKENVKCVVRKVLSYGKKSFKSSTLHLPTYVRLSNYKKTK